MAVVGTAAEEGSAARRFWLRSQKEVMFIAYTPFVVCLAAGRLDVEVFRQYIAQEVHFLRAFASAYEMAAEYADDDDDKDAILDMKKVTLAEQKLHNSVMKEWGVDPNKENNPDPATVKYTGFVLATAKGKVEGGKGPGQIATPFEKTKIAAYTVGAMTPCMRLYAHLGKELQKFLPEVGSDHPYKEWIDYYSAKSFEAATVQLEELLDKLSVPLTGEELGLIEKIYLQAMKLEIEFFSAQPIAQPAVVPLIKLHDPMEQLFIFSDFDLTCSVVDSFAILAEIAILTAPKTDQGAADAKKISSDTILTAPQTDQGVADAKEISSDTILTAPKTEQGVADAKEISSDTILTALKTEQGVADAKRISSEMRNSWSALSNQYTEEYETCITNLLPKEKVKEFEYGRLYKSLEQLANFEKCANSRVVESGMLRGLNLGDIKRAGELLKLHDGCKEFFQKVVKKKEMLKVDLHILSYCWCADLIRSAFSSVGCLSELTIHSNEFNFEESISTGEIDIKMQSPLDKVEAFTNVLNQSSSENRLSVYIGDSVGDLLCLLKADIGIVVGSSASLRKVGKQFGVFFSPLYPGVVAKQRLFTGEGSSGYRGFSGILYTASNWSEIQAFILGA